MLIDDLQTVVEGAKRNKLSTPLTRNLLKEVLQYYVLVYIYASDYGKKLIFTGGSCLRICYGLNRLSEDLDFDLVMGIEINKQQLADDLVKYFKSDLQYKDIEVNIAGRGEKIYLKFPILRELGLAEKRDEMKKLFVKVELDKNPSQNYQTDLTPIAKYNLNFLVRSYDLSSLMANKIAAVLSRTWQKGKSKITFKGRDYYDLLWLLQKGIQPNMLRLRDSTRIKSKKELVSKLKSKTKSISMSYLKEDLINLFEDSKFVAEITKNYRVLVDKYIKNI